MVQSFCDRILVLDKGRLVEDLSSRTITRQASAPATRRLLEANLFLSRAPAAEP